MTDQELRAKCLELAVRIHETYSNHIPRPTLNPVEMANKFYEFSNNGIIDDFRLPGVFTSRQDK